MRLTTLNLDDECTEILRREENKSRYVRAAIKRYPEVVADLDEMEDLYIHLRNSYDALVRFLVDHYGMNDDADLGGLLAAFCEEPELEVSRAYNTGHLRVMVRSAASRRGSL